MFPQMLLAACALQRYVYTGKFQHLFDLTNENVLPVIERSTALKNYQSLLQDEIVYVDLRLFWYFKDEYGSGNGRDYGGDCNFNVEIPDRKSVV